MSTVRKSQGTNPAAAFVVLAKEAVTKTFECFGWKLWHIYAGSALRRLKGSLSLSSLLLGLLVVLRVFMGV